MTGIPFNTRKASLATALSLSIAAIASGTAQANLETGAILVADDGFKNEFCPLGGTPPNCASNATASETGGSWFSMDTSGDGVTADSEKTIVDILDNIPIGITKAAIGSHGGLINDNEQPAFDIWEFFGNTGMHQLTHPLVETSPGSTIMDMSGWNVTWNGIPSIPLEGDFDNFNAETDAVDGTGIDTGFGEIACDPSPCADGSTFLMTFATHVPVGDPSNFGGTQYKLNMVGTVIMPEPLTTNADGINPGSVVGAGNTRVTVDELAAAGVPLDTDTESGVENIAGAYFDFDVDISSNPNGNAQVIIPLSIAMPADAIYRSFDPAGGTWNTFIDDGVNNILESAPGTVGKCAAVTTWEAGLQEGYYCVRMTIQDNGLNDYNSTAGVISDPSGIGAGEAPPPPESVPVPHGTSGCTAAGLPTAPASGAQWLLLAGFIGWLGFKGQRSKRSV